MKINIKANFSSTLLFSGEYWKVCSEKEQEHLPEKKEGNPIKKSLAGFYDHNFIYETFISLVSREKFLSLASSRTNVEMENAELVVINLGSFSRNLISVAI